MKNKIKTLPVIMIIFVLLLAACGKSDTADSNTGNEILIGEVDSLTGPAAAYGIGQNNAIKMAIDEINDSGGVTVDGKKYKFKLTTYDDKGDPNEAIAATRKLIDRDGAKYIVGWAVSASTTGVSKIIGNEDALMLVGTASDKSIVTQGHKNIFRVRPPSGFTGGPSGKFVAEQGVTKLAVLGQLKDPTYIDYFDNFKKEFTSSGGSIVGEESFSVGDRDMYTQLTKIINKNPDAIFVPGSVEPVAFVFKQLRELSFKGEIYSFTGGTPEQFAKVVEPEKMDGIYDLRPLETTYEAMSDTGKKYVENYKKKYNISPVPNAVYAYDQVYVLKDALEKSNSLEVSKLIKTIKDMKPPKEVALSYLPIDGKMFDENGQGYTTNVAMQWENGEWKFVKEMPGDPVEFSKYLSTLTEQNK